MAAPGGPAGMTAQQPAPQPSPDHPLGLLRGAGEFCPISQLHVRELPSGSVTPTPPHPKVELRTSKGPGWGGQREETNTVRWEATSSQPGNGLLAPNVLLNSLFPFLSVHKLCRDDGGQDKTQQDCPQKTQSLPLCSPPPPPRPPDLDPHSNTLSGTPGVLLPAQTRKIYPGSSEDRGPFTKKPKGKGARAGRWHSRLMEGDETRCERVGFLMSLCLSSQSGHGSRISRF